MSLLGVLINGCLDCNENNQEAWIILHTYEQTLYVTVVLHTGSVLRSAGFAIFWHQGSCLTSTCQTHASQDSAQTRRRRIEMFSFPKIRASLQKPLANDTIVLFVFIPNIFNIEYVVVVSSNQTASFSSREKHGQTAKQLNFRHQQERYIDIPLLRQGGELLNRIIQRKT